MKFTINASISNETWGFFIQREETDRTPQAWQMIRLVPNMQHPSVVNNSSTPTAWRPLSLKTITGRKVIKVFHAQLNLARNWNYWYKLKYRQIKKSIVLSLSDVVFIMLIKFKMPTLVGILTYMNMIHFVLSWVEYEKSFITPRLGFRTGYSQPSLLNYRD